MVKKYEVCERCVERYGLNATGKPSPPKGRELSRDYLYEQCAICLGRSAPLEVNEGELEKAQAQRKREMG